MTVEQRESTTAHGLEEPLFDQDEQLSQAIRLNHLAAGDQDSLTWFHVVEIIDDQLPIITTYREVAEAVRSVMKMNTWREVVQFVQNDQCTEFFNLALSYCLSEGQRHKRDKGFIDGSGIGYIKAYATRLKVTLEKCFDAKYFYKVERPLVYALSNGIDLTGVANWIHPGHWSYPAGHGTKFLTAVEVLDDVFHLDTNCYTNLFIAACVASMGRSGSLIHYPIDNLAGGHFTTLNEFKK